MDKSDGLRTVRRQAKIKTDLMLDPPPKCNDLCNYQRLSFVSR
jgi:hypothetical protein